MDSLHHVDVDWKSGQRSTYQFATAREAVACAAEMAMDSRISFSAVRGLGMDSAYPEVDKLERQGFKLVAKGDNGWTEYYENEGSGRKAIVSYGPSVNSSPKISIS